MSESVFERLSAWLTENGVAFEVTRHAAVFTSEQAAKIRGVSLSSGAKALVCKVDSGFAMFVLPANRRLASRNIKKQLGIRKIRFANSEEIQRLTQLQPGSIPPFGSLFGLPTWCDIGLSSEEQINFNAGDHAISISMSLLDYQRVEDPRMASIAE